MMRSLCLTLLLLVGGAAHAVNPTQFNWDLSYQQVLQNHPIDKNEFMHIWTKRHPNRVVQDYLNNYEGPEIQSALLIEHPDSQADDSVATLFYTTTKTASSCRFRGTENSTRACGELNHAKVLAFVNSMEKLEPIQPPKGQNNIIGTRDGRSITMDHYGFVSIFHNGRSLQRPIIAIEMNQPQLNVKKIEHWGRIVALMSKHLLSDEQRAQLAKVIEQTQAQPKQESADSSRQPAK